jgi:hypothetical protein
MRLALCFAAIASVVPAQADTLSERMAAERIARQRNIDVDIVRNQQRRERFATGQRSLRETDRVAGQRPGFRLDVPRIQPGCQIRIRGNSAISGSSGCR